MPASKEARTIKLRVDLVPKLEDEWDKSKKLRPALTNEAFGGYVNDLLEDMIANLAYLEKEYPHLDLAGYSGNVLYIRDSKRRATAEIYRHDDRIKCELDNSFDCEHIMFALGRPEIAKLNIRRPRS